MGTKRYRGDTPDLFRQFKDLDRRIRDLETGPQAAFTTVSRGAFIIKNDGSLVVAGTTGDSIAFTETGGQSSNYVPGVDGWFIGPDGSAEFNDALFRGAVEIGQAPGGQILIDNEAMPDELASYYGGHIISDASIRMMPGDDEQSYYYQLVGYDYDLDYRFFADGWVYGPDRPNMSSVHPLTQYSYFGSTDVSQVDWMDENQDSRFINHAQFSFFDGFLEVGAGPGPANAYGFQSDGPAYFLDDLRMQLPGGAFVAESGTSINADDGSDVSFDNGASFQIDGIEQARNFYWCQVLTSSVTSGATSGTEYTMIVTSTLTFRAGRAYCFRSPYGKMHVAAVAQPVINLWKIPTTGTYTPGAAFSATGATQIGNGPREQIIIAAQDQKFQPHFIFVVSGASDVTCRVVMTAVPNNANAVVLSASTGPGAVLYDIIDIGTATQYSGMPSL